MKHTMLVLTLTLLLSSAVSAQAGNTASNPGAGVGAGLGLASAQTVSGNTIDTPGNSAGTANPSTALPYEEDPSAVVMNSNSIWYTVIGLPGFRA